MKFSLIFLIVLCLTQNVKVFDKKVQSNQSIEMSEVEPKSLSEKEKKSIVRDLSSSNYVKYNLVTESLSFEYMNTNRNGHEDETQHVFKSNELFEDADEINLRDIIGDDDRTQILNPKIQPYLPTVFIRTKYENVYNNVLETYKNRPFRGSGFFVASNIVLTAGHNVFGDVSEAYYDDDNELHTEWEDYINNPCFPDVVEIFAGANGFDDTQVPYSFYAKVVKINIATNYYNNNDDSNYDWAILELDRNIGIRTLGYGLVSNTYCFNEPSVIYGYPGDKDYTMWESPGKIILSTTRQYVHNMDTIRGSSGSPIFINYNNEMYVCGIHTHWINQSTNGGTIINNLILNIVEYLASDANEDNLIGTIQKTDYGFPDNYTTDLSDSEYFTNHVSSTGLHFQTKRYRTGYIHDECVVMSDIRNGIYSAFLTYHFFVPITKIEVDLSHWRELSHEWTYSTETTCVLRVGTYVVADLLSSEINLTTNRNFPIKYTFIMPTPTDTFTFEMNALVGHNNNDNRGRVCIGQLDLYYETN